MLSCCSNGISCWMLFSNQILSIQLIFKCIWQQIASKKVAALQLDPRPYSGDNLQLHFAQLQLLVFQLFAIYSSFRNIQLFQDKYEHILSKCYCSNLVVVLITFLVVCYLATKYLNAYSSRLQGVSKESYSPPAEPRPKRRPVQVLIICSCLSPSLVPRPPRFRPPRFYLHGCEIQISSKIWEWLGDKAALHLTATISVLAVCYTCLAIFITADITGITTVYSQWELLLCVFL